MKFTYCIVPQADGILAECVESDAAAEGKTEREAVEALKKSLEERMFRPDAVAPPSRPTKDVIELVRAPSEESASKESKEERTVDLGGPGDAPLH